MPVRHLSFRPRDLRSRAVVAAVATAVIGGILLTAAPAQALTFDGQPVDSTARFTVAGAHYTLRDRSVGTATRTIHVGGTSGKVFTHYRLVLRSSTGRVLADVRRGLEKADTIFTRFDGVSFPTERAFLAAEHRALTMSARTAKAHYLRSLRIESVESDLEATIGRAFDAIDATPAGAEPDFAAVRTVKSGEYPGTSTVSGNDRTYWTVTVRDTRDGYGITYDHASGAEATFRF